MKFTKVNLPYQFKPSKAQGLTNDLLILNDKYFVKRSKELTKSFLNWDNQLNVIELIKDQSFTLKILETKISEQKLWTLMPYYQNLSNLTQNQINFETLKKIADLVKQLHQVEIKDTKIIKWNPLEQLDLYCKLTEPEANFKIKATEIKTKLVSWLTNYQPKKITLCHNDLIADNFVNYENKWYLIDWDFATLNDYLFDVASFASETLKKPSDIKFWYELFNLTDSELTIVSWWTTYQNLIWYHWALFLYQKTNNKIYQVIADEKKAMLLK